ncbi:PAS domain-containing protein [Haloarchaeobius sp. DT45]|uniref:PAS domain-containing sensor histidine kinase n=1 Tax=Haloarchaeobius sp. DT45 TaxID=3446116 RepID=UPI003F6C98EF
MNPVRVCLADGSGEEWVERVSTTLADQGRYDVFLTTTLSETLSTIDERVHCLVVGTTLDGDEGIDLLDALAGGTVTGESDDCVSVFVADDDDVAREALTRGVTEVLSTRTVVDDPDVLVRRLVRHLSPERRPTSDVVGEVATALVDATTGAEVLAATCDALVGCQACDGSWALLVDGETGATAGTVTTVPADATDQFTATRERVGVGVSVDGTSVESVSVDGDAVVSLATETDPLGVLVLSGERVAPPTLDALGRVVTHALVQTRQLADLRATERRLGAVVDSIPDLVTIKTPDGRHVFVNAAAAVADGPGRDGILGKRLEDLVDEDAAAEAWAHDERAMQTGETITSEVTLRVDGRPYRYEVTHAALYDEAGAVEGVINVGADVTEERRNAERLSALYRGNERLLLTESPTEVAELAVELFADVLDYSLTCVYDFDPQRDELVPLAWSDDLVAVAGDPEPIPHDDGVAWQAFVGDEVRTDVTEITSSGDRVPWGDFVLPLGRHGVVVVGTTDETLPPQDEALGKVLAATVETMLDRLDRVEALRDREAALARQNERLDEFASVVSHDLRNPLSIAKTYLSLAEADEDADYTTEIATALDRMDELVTDVLELARQGRVLGETEPLDLAAVATISWSVVDTAGASLSLADDLGTIDADQVRLQQLFENLFRNSVEHGGPDHRGELATEQLTVRVGRLDPPDVGFFVEDDGVGIPPDQREAVFERGVTGSSDGTGFGLAIVALIVDAHGWELDLVSGTDGGARFEIRTKPRTER